MQITRLKLAGFKSFPDPADLLIEPGLTGIVGPNGCGKSNLVEALRWVMGESSARGLRGGEMEDVIFSGSSGRPPFDRAEVGLRLQGPVEGLPALAGAEEVEIARQLGRGSGSTYRINGREARARDVQLLFADAGAGARSAAIIGQGQIGFIVDAKPQERRRLLEDGAGIGGLHGRRREAELRLQSTEQNLARLLDLLAEQEKRLAELGRQNRQAARYRKLAAELRTAEALLALARHRAALRAHEAAGLALAEARRGRVASQDRLTALRGESRALATRLALARTGIGELVAREAGLAERHGARVAEQAAAGERRREIEARASEATRELLALEAERSTIDQRRGTLEAELATLGGQVREESGRQAELERRLAEAEQALAEAGQAERRTEAARGRAEDALAAVRQRRQEAEQRRGEVEAGLAALPAERPAADGAALADGLAARLETLLAEQAALEATAARQQQARQEAEAAQGRIEAASAPLTAELAEVDRRCRDQQAAGAALAERERALRRQEERLAARHEAHRARRAQLERKQAGLDVEGARAEQARTAAALLVATAEDERARAAMAVAASALSEARAAEAAARGALQAVAAECRLVEELLPAVSASALIDRVTVEEGYGDALAAALGDDLLAGSSAEEGAFWQEMPADASVIAADPPLPAEIEPLAGRIVAPPLLARRLAQIGIVAADAAAASIGRLRPGQRLVSLDGGLWRWDGLVRRPDEASVAASRLRHHRRHEDLLAQRAVREHEAAETAARTAAAGPVAAAAERAAEAARLALAGAGRAAAEAARRLEQVEQVLRSAAAEERELVAEALVMEREQAELAEERRELTGRRPDMAALAEQERRLLSLRQLVQEQERQLKAAAGARRAAEQALVELERRRQQQGRQIEQLRAELEQARRRAAEAAVAEAARRAEIATRRSALEVALAELVVQLDRLRADETAAATLADSCRTAHAAADAALLQARAAREDLHRREQASRAAHDQAARRQVEHRAELKALAVRGDESEARHAAVAARAGRTQAELAEAVRLLERSAEAVGQCAAELATLARAREAAEAAAAGDEALAGAEAGLLAAAEEADGGAREALALAEAGLERAEAALAAAATQAARLPGLPEPLPAELQAELEEADPELILARRDRLEAARDRLGPVNLRAEIELAELQQALDQSRAEEAELRAAAQRLQRAIATINREGKERLLQAFEVVDRHFRHLFARLFGGGRAQLRLTDMADPLNAGLELEASPPGKRLTSVGLLSGGEKTLTGLALVFAFFLAQPAPLCVLDEVDAPLDDANVDRFVALMEEIATGTGTRFLVVTHHPLTMANMHRLYGVTMLERGISRLVSVALDDAIEMRATG